MLRVGEVEALLPVLGVAVGEAEGDREEQVILRSTLLPESDMTMEPEARATMPAGELKVARVEKPSKEPAEPVPATVLTEPEEGSSPLMRMLEESASSSLPEASTVSWKGLLKLAAKPLPSEKEAAPLPPTVETMPSMLTRRTLLPPLSET